MRQSSSRRPLGMLTVSLAAPVPRGCFAKRSRRVIGQQEVQRATAFLGHAHAAGIIVGARDAARDLEVIAHVNAGHARRRGDDRPDAHPVPVVESVLSAVEECLIVRSLNVLSCGSRRSERVEKSMTSRARQSDDHETSCAFNSTSPYCAGVLVDTLASCMR